METKYIILREEKSLETWVNYLNTDFDLWDDAYHWLKKHSQENAEGRFRIEKIFIIDK